MLRFCWKPMMVNGLLIVMALTFCLSSSLFAQEAAKKAAAKAEVEAKQDTEAVDPLAIPDGDAAEILAFIQKLRSQRPAAKSRDEFYAAIRKSHSVIVDAADKVLAMEKLEDQQALQAVQAKFGALSILGQVGDGTATAKALAFASSLESDDRPAIKAEAAKQILMAKVNILPKMSEDERVAYVDEVTEFLGEEIGRPRFSLAMNVASRLERTGQTELAAKAYRKFASMVKDSEDETIARYGVKLEGAARRITLMGKTMDLDGETADGSEFDWSSYRGKVVLVDFWASWCGPCIAELPNVKDNYKKYHELGFDVVGVNLDNSKDKLDRFVEDREIPWVNLFSSNPDTQGWEHPIVNRYGVMGIPTAILVDKEGKVVSLNARGPILSQKLTELLGAAPESKDEDSQDEKAGQ